MLPPAEYAETVNVRIKEIHTVNAIGLKNLNPFLFRIIFAITEQFSVP